MSESTAIAHLILERHALHPELDALLGGVLDSCFQHRCEPGEVLCREGDPTRDLFFLLDGEVEVRMRDLAGEERLIATLLAPTMFGHMGMIDGAPRSATCIAPGQARLALMGRELFGSLLDDPGPGGDIFRRLLLAAMSQQLAKGNEALRRFLDPAIEAPEAFAAERLRHASGTLEGWR